MHIFPMVYNPFLPLYYNNNQKFLQKRLDANVIKHSTIFEKSEIKWVCIDELEEMKPQFRYYFVDIVDKILSKQKEIDAFARRALLPRRKSARKTRRARK
jgi:transcription termination factor NusB